jgi:biopolymer transport protein ExbB/TolQ
MNRWVNVLSLVPGTSLTILVISIAFLRFYDETDFLILGQLANPRVWSNRLTVAAIVVALVNFGFEWNDRNRERNRLAEEIEFRVRQENFITAEEQRRAEEEQRRAEEEQRRAEEEQRRAEEKQRRSEDRARAEEARARAENERAEAREQTARRTRIETERDIALLSFLVDPSEQNQQTLRRVLDFLREYRETLM